MGDASPRSSGVWIGFGQRFRNQASKAATARNAGMTNAAFRNRAGLGIATALGRSRPSATRTVADEPGSASGRLGSVFGAASAAAALASARVRAFSAPFCAARLVICDCDAARFAALAAAFFDSREARFSSLFGPRLGGFGARVALAGLTGAATAGDPFAAGFAEIAGGLAVATLGFDLVAATAATSIGFAGAGFTAGFCGATSSQPASMSPSVGESFAGSTLLVAGGGAAGATSHPASTSASVLLVIRCEGA